MVGPWFRRENEKVEEKNSKRGVDKKKEGKK
jgi:hypothetical protein